MAARTDAIMTAHLLRNLSIRVNMDITSPVYSARWVTRLISDTMRYRAL